MKYYLVVFGCQMNISDSERVASVLEKSGYKKTSNIAEANLAVITMCSVRQSAVDRVYGIVEKLKLAKKTNPKLKRVLTGCVLKKDKKDFEKLFDSVLNIKDMCGGEYLNIIPKYSSKLLANVPIMTGCNNFCSYCVVPYARGKEISRPAEDIVNEVKKLVQKKYKNIWLLGQNVNSYKDLPRGKAGKKTNFPKLLKMVNNIPGNFELNFTSSHPKDFSDELIQTMVKCKKLSNRLNLPIQSGDDNILKKMNRPYTVTQYKNLVIKIRKAIPNISISTDVIVGFPGETKKQFQNTVKTFKEIKFDMAFINKYSPRAGTTAALMKDNVPWTEKKRREKILIKLINE